MQTIDTLIQDAVEYANIYDDGQIVMLDAMDEMIAEQEIKMGNMGQMNEAMRKMSSEMEKMAFDMFRRGGLDEVPRQMREGQARMVAQAG